MLYIVIFVLKIIENTLSTLRIILISKGKKIVGSILQGLVAFIWILSTSIVIIDNDILKIIFFILGSTIGSYLGSSIEERFRQT